eukprot:gene9451-32432_t
MQPPDFTTQKVTESSLELHTEARGKRAGLGRNGGIANVVARDFYDIEVEMVLLRSVALGTSDHDVYSITFPPHCSKLTERSITGVHHEEELLAHPFHFALDETCHFVQIGSGLRRLHPEVSLGSHASDIFKIRMPDCAWDYDQLCEYERSFLILRTKTGLEFKGQLVPTVLPARTDLSAPTPLLTHQASLRAQAASDCVSPRPQATLGCVSHHAQAPSRSVAASPQSNKSTRAQATSGCASPHAQAPSRSVAASPQSNKSPRAQATSGCVSPRAQVPSRSASASPQSNKSTPGPKPGKPESKSVPKEFSTLCSTPSGTTSTSSTLRTSWSTSNMSYFERCNLPKPTASGIPSPPEHSCHANSNRSISTSKLPKPPADDSPPTQSPSFSLPKPPKTLYENEREWRSQAEATQQLPSRCPFSSGGEREGRSQEEAAQQLPIRCPFSSGGLNSKSPAQPASITRLGNAGPHTMPHASTQVLKETIALALHSSAPTSMFQVQTLANMVVSMMETIITGNVVTVSEALHLRETIMSLGPGQDIHTARDILQQMKPFILNDGEDDDVNESLMQMLAKGGGQDISTPSLTEHDMAELVTMRNKQVRSTSNKDSRRPRRSVTSPPISAHAATTGITPTPIPTASLAGSSVTSHHISAHAATTGTTTTILTASLATSLSESFVISPHMSQRGTSLSGPGLVPLVPSPSQSQSYEEYFDMSRGTVNRENSIDNEFGLPPGYTGTGHEMLQHLDFSTSRKTINRENTLDNEFDSPPGYTGLGHATLQVQATLPVRSGGASYTGISNTSFLLQSESTFSISEEQAVQEGQAVQPGGGHTSGERYSIENQYQILELLNFLYRIEEGYLDNPYHSKVHAADVLRTKHAILTRGGVMKVLAPPEMNESMRDITMLACYLSAVVHDYEHKGFNNDFLVRSGDPLALTYNDKSPMENHHVNEVVRRHVITNVLATDMKQHFTVLSQFNTKFVANSEIGTAPPEDAAGKAARQGRATTPEDAPGKPTKQGRTTTPEDVAGKPIKQGTAELGNYKSFDGGALDEDAAKGSVDGGSVDGGSVDGGSAYIDSY